MMHDSLLNFHSVFLDTLYSQKSVSENARNTFLEVENTKMFLGRIPPYPLLLHTTPHQTFVINNLFTLDDTPQPGVFVCVGGYRPRARNFRQGVQNGPKKRHVFSVPSVNISTTSRD
jgi:hypothetical protein